MRNRIVSRLILGVGILSCSCMPLAIADPPILPGTIYDNTCNGWELIQNYNGRTATYFTGSEVAGDETWEGSFSVGVFDMIATLSFWEPAAPIVPVELSGQIPYCDVYSWSIVSNHFTEGYVFNSYIEEGPSVIAPHGLVAAFVTASVEIQATGDVCYGFGTDWEYWVSGSGSFQDYIDQAIGFYKIDPLE
jgi:hypothetical protein